MFVLDCMFYVLVGLEITDKVFQAFGRQAVFSDGLVASWSSLITVESTCQFDVTYFPFDEQDCDVSIGPWMLDKEVYRIGKKYEDCLIPNFKNFAVN